MPRSMDQKTNEVMRGPSKSLQTYYKLSLSTEQYFHQDSARGRQAESLGTVYNFPKHFGLKSSDWKGFDELLKTKNAEHPGQVEYVLIFVARHGQGFHNIGEEYLGSGTWKKISSLSPKKPIHEYFLDSRLTPVGQYQTDILSRTFKTLLEDTSSPMPWPQAFYVSPLHRALETSCRTWAPLSTSHRPYNPQVHESLREQVYIDCCNQRSPLSVMENFSFSHHATTTTTAPPPPPSSTSKPVNAAGQPESTTQNFTDTFTITSSSLGPFTNEDKFFNHQRNMVGRNETENETTLRAYSALTHILAENWGKGIQYMSITTHGGFMSGIYQIFGLQHHDVPRFPTGIVVPLLIRAEKVDSPVTLAEVALSNSHWGDGAPGKIESVSDRTLDQVLHEIRDPDVYHRLIRLVEEARMSGAAEDPEWKDQRKANLNPLERIIVKALL